MEKGTHEIITEYENMESDPSVHTEPILKNPEPGHIPVLRQLGVAVFLLFFVFSTSYVATLLALFEPEDHISDIYVSTELTDKTRTHSMTQDPFREITLQADAAFVWDIRDQTILFSKNADKILPIASVTKLMTALVAYEILDDESNIDITIDAVKTDGDSGLKDGETFSLSSLTDMVLIASSNDGATALSATAGSAVEGSVDPNKIFVHAMNLRASELGLTNTRFKNATGLDISSTEAGAVSTAREIAFLMEFLITHYPQVTRFSKVDEARIYNERGEFHDVENTNEVVNSIQGLIASKTGYTDLAGGNLVVAFESGLNRPIVAVVLGSTFNDRFTDILKLSDASREYIASQPK